MTEQILAEVGVNLTNRITEVLMEAAFSNIKEQYEKMQDVKAMNKACEGVRADNIEADMKAIATTFSDEVVNGIGYTNEELRVKFDKYYNEYVLCGISRDIEDDTREELWKRFLIYTKEALKKYDKSITYGEKRILETVRENQELLKEIKTAGLNKEFFKSISEQQSKMLEELCKDIEIPFIDIGKVFGVRVEEYQPKYFSYGNTFDFDDNIERSEGVSDNTYIMRLLIRNIGRTIIEKIKVSNVQVNYARDITDDNPEFGCSILPIVSHDDSQENSINILPNEEQVLNFVFSDKKEELWEEDHIEEFLSYFYYDRLYVEYDMELQGKKQNKYHYHLFLSKIRSDEESINGVYDIDYVGVKMM